MALSTISSCAQVSKGVHPREGSMLHLGTTGVVPPRKVHEAVGTQYSGSAQAGLNERSRGEIEVAAIRTIVEILAQFR